MKVAASMRELNLPAGFGYRADLAQAPTAGDLKSAPRHRWFYFPHSYSHRLIDAVLADWHLPKGSILADNFVGSGTTLLAARQRGYSSVGFDLSPLAILISNAKVASYELEQIRNTLESLLKYRNGKVSVVPDRLLKAFTEKELLEIFKLLIPVRQLRNRKLHRFFLVAILWTARKFSRAVPDGGWFRWRDWPDQSSKFREAFMSTVADMLEDVTTLNWTDGGLSSEASKADARNLPIAPTSVDGLITSPPYANRHDYSRIFHIDLLLAGVDEAGVTGLRHKSMRSHVEAKSQPEYCHKLDDFEGTDSLKSAVASLPDDADSRIEPMLKGYFEDIFLSLCEVARVLKPGGRSAYVVGNVRHAGVMIPVDKILSEMALPAGLTFENAWVMRFRGNSAQQMATHGREPARETIVFFSKGEAA